MEKKREKEGVGHDSYEAGCDATSIMFLSWFSSLKKLNNNEE